MAIYGDPKIALGAVPITGIFGLLDLYHKSKKIILKKSLAYSL